MIEGTRIPAPWHLWAVGGLGLLWNAYGALDYVMSVTRNADYLSSFPPEMIALLDSFPVWANSAWAIGVWASVLGSVLLLIRSRHAVLAFLASVAGAVVSFLYQMTLDLPPELGGMMATVIPLIVMVLILLQWWYARRQTEAGVLR